MEFIRRTRKRWKREKTDTDSPYLKQILSLHHEGWSCPAIASIIGKDRTTVLFHLRRLGIPKGVPRVFVQTTRTLNIQIKKESLKKGHKYSHLIDESINPGKSYAEYLRDAGKTEKQIRTALSEMKKNK